MYSMSTRPADDQRSAGRLLMSKQRAPNASQPMVVPRRPVSSSHATICSRPYVKMSSSYPAGPLGPQYGHMFASARSCLPPGNLGSAEPYPRPTAKGSLTSSPNQTPPSLWKRWTSLNCKEAHSHVNSTVFQRQFSCDHERMAYGRAFSPLFVHTLCMTFSTSIIPGTEWSTNQPCSTVRCDSLLSGLAQGTTTSKARPHNCAFLETETDSSSHTKHSDTECLATEARVHECTCTSIETGNREDTDGGECSRGSSTTRHISGDRESLCGDDYVEVDSEVESGVSYYSEGDSESDDDIVFSNEADSTLQVDYIPCKGKMPSQGLLTLLSDESGFGENSFTESCDSECDDEQWGSGNIGYSLKDSNKIDHSLSHSVPKFSSSSTSAYTRLHSMIDCLQQGTSTAHFKHNWQSLLRHSQVMNRLSMSRVCAQRHRNCCKPHTHTLQTSDCSPPLVAPCHKKKVSFVPDSELVKVHHIVVWNYAHRSCRKGPWEQYARDRGHFRCRIDRISSIIEPCLQKKLEQMYHT